MAEKVLMAAEDIRRALTRIAHEVLENNQGHEGLLFIGIATRGVPLAQRLAQAVSSIENATIPVGSLPTGRDLQARQERVSSIEDVTIPVGSVDIGLYRDDLSSRETRPVLGRSFIPIDITGSRVVLVDDVLFTGRSIRAALDAIMDLGRPQRIQLAVLVDRGHRELPIRPDYVGKNVPSAREEEVLVRLQETDGRDEVVLIKKGQQ